MNEILGPNENPLLPSEVAIGFISSDFESPDHEAHLTQEIGATGQQITDTVGEIKSIIAQLRQ